MNFLAHLVLSPKETDFISGNIAADFLKGIERKIISKGVQSGISMHRFVDKFTDSHVLIKTSKDRIRKHFRLLSGVLIDVFYDHRSQLPPRLRQFVPVMIRENILFSYRKLAGIQTALTRINLRVTRKFSVGSAMAILNDMYDFLEDDFRQYFPCLINVTERYRKDYGTFLLAEHIN
jgi:acyl carrier protein phosphodiesterase